ncbi:IS1595 family transposase [Campylobacter concisus]|uniref:IS1595 family transposase n=2 Tax=Campylobacter TaxID=194 RepID=A0A7S9RRT0_9BACT|nr:IS1595 family transposase [Campylobacter concisus]QPH96537.1 IS1595 family transposase [Campylobacter concisus]
MSQHFLLSSKARTISVRKIASMSENECYEYFKSIRWSSNKGNPVCPTCGSASSHYFIESRLQYRCKDCFHTFSVTSGTIFHSHKLDFKVILLAIVIFSNATKGISALQLSRDLDVQYKTAWVLSHKIRESLMTSDNGNKFSGVVEMDGVYVGNYIKLANNINDRIDRRKAFKPNKRVIISLRERNLLGSGASKTKTFILKSENNIDINAIAKSHIAPNSEIHTDENSAYDDLLTHYDLKRVNHQIEYSGLNGENNNQSESFNARFRRLQYGQCHKLGTLYLSNYANEIAYREDTRRLDNKAIMDDILSRCLADNSISNEFCGYWQGNHRVAERLGA